MDDLLKDKRRCFYHNRPLWECEKSAHEIHGFPKGFNPCVLALKSQEGKTPSEAEQKLARIKQEILEVINS